MFDARASTVLVTGATGYIGGRLIPLLLERGCNVRVLVRNAAHVRGRAWSEQVEVFEGDVMQPASLDAALSDVDAAYYLIHSMNAGGDFAERDRQAARNFSAAARAVPHTIYLGGLVPTGPNVSEHLASRGEVGRILREHLPVTEFRAGPIIGSGSASFEMIRYLTERLPVMVAPRWIMNEVQPIAVRDVLSYLIGALDTGPIGVVEIGADRLTFRDTMLTYAKVRGLHRVISPVPVLAPRLAALWVGVVTPITNRLAVPLIAGVVHPVIADVTRARALFPEIVPMSYRAAVQRAMARVEDGEVATRWSGAAGDTRPTYDVTDVEGMIREVRTVEVTASPDQVFRTLCGLGGDNGWLVWEWAWKFRGFIDRLAGGPGLRRGRRDAQRLLVGEALDFWRVEAVDPPHGLRLRAEMKVPGSAWLEWTVHPTSRGTRLVQTAMFAPRGLGGMMYWYGLYPIHRRIFSDMIRAIAARATAPA